MTVGSLRSFASVVLVVVTIAGQGLDTTASGPDQNAAAVPPGIRESVVYLTGQDGISEQEAVRRLALQREAAPLAERLSKQFPGQYAGMWLDQDRGGVLMIAMTRPELLGTALRRFPQRSHTRVVAAHRPLRDLTRLAERLRQWLGGHGIDATVDEVHNRVVAWTADASAVAAARTRIRRLGVEPAEIDVRAIGPRSDNACRSQNDCDPPMRGGIRLDVWDSSRTDWLWSCTSAFNVKGSNGWSYSMTAGHCLQGAAWRTTHAGKPVGYWKSELTRMTYPTDYAIMPFETGSTDWATYWLGGVPRNRVYSLCDTGDRRCRTDPLYAITGMYTFEQIKVGWVVCSSGVSTHTHCGVITSKNQGIVTNICQHHGDSGAPLYSQVDRRAYGIHSFDDTNNDTCPAGYHSYFSPLSKIFTNAKANTGLTFFLFSA